MPSLSDIERQTKTFAAVRSELVELVSELQAQIDQIKRVRLATLRRLTGKTAEQHAILKTLIEDAKDLFKKPRTLIFHGIKIGFDKGKGGIAFDDADAVVERIHKLAGFDPAALIHIKESPNKEALGQLPAADLKKLGCSIKDAGDQVVIKPTDSEVEKLVDALLKDATAENQA